MFRESKNSSQSYSCLVIRMGMHNAHVNKLLFVKQKQKLKTVLICSSRTVLHQSY